MYWLASFAGFVELVVYWWTTDFRLGLAFVGAHILWLLALGIVIGGGAVVRRSERTAARTWLVLPAWIALTPHLSRFFGVWAVVLSALLLTWWASRERGHRPESVLVASLTGSAYGVHLARFLRWDYAARDTAWQPLVLLGLTGGLAIAIYLAPGFRRSSRPMTSTPGTIGLAAGIASLAVLVTAATGESVPQALFGLASMDERPPIVLVVLDTVRADHLTLHGYERNTMPALAAFGEGEAVVVERAITNGPDECERNLVGN